MTATGQIETCHACGLSFAVMPGESTSSLVFRYTQWREAHRDCVLAEQQPSAPVEQGAAAVGN